MDKKLKIALYVACTIILAYFGVVSPFRYSDRVSNEFISDKIEYHRSDNPESIDDINDPIFKSIIKQADEVSEETFAKKASVITVWVSIGLFLFSFLYKKAEPVEISYFYWPMLIPLAFYPFGFLYVIPIVFWVFGFKVRRKLKEL